MIATNRERMSNFCVLVDLTENGTWSARKKQPHKANRNPGKFDFSFYLRVLSRTKMLRMVSSELPQICGDLKNHFFKIMHEKLNILTGKKIKCVELFDLLAFTATIMFCVVPPDLQRSCARFLKKFQMSKENL